MRRAVPTLIAFGLIAVAAAPATAQAIDSARLPAGAGWTMTPSLLANTMWDDNVLVRGQGDNPQNDLVNVINPRIDVDFIGRRGEFSGAYDGAFLLYRTLSDLNSYDQNSSVSGRRLLTKHIALTARNQFMTAPTTEQFVLIGVPFVRTGSMSEFFQAGVEAGLSKRMSIEGTYNFQIVSFDQAPSLTYLLPGGHSHGATVVLRRTVTNRTSVTGSYNMQVATVGGMPDAFRIYNGEAGVERRLSDHVQLSVAGGIARLATHATGPARTGPSLRVRLARDFQASTVDVAYSRSYVPSYGFGGTQQNEELRTNARVTLRRALYSQSMFAWRRNESLAVGSPKLNTWAYSTAVGWMLERWVGIEGFFDSTSQRIDLPGGASDHRRLGVQVVTTKPMRIR